MTHHPGDLAATSLDLLEDFQLRILGTPEALAKLEQREQERIQSAARARAWSAQVHRTTA